MLKKVFAAILVFAVALICGLSMVSPPENLHRYTHTGEDTVKTLRAEDIDGFEGCKLGRDSLIEVTDEGAAVVFTDIDVNFNSIRINTSEFKEALPVQVLVDKGAGYIINDTAYAHFLKGDKGISLNIDGQGIVALKIIIMGPYSLESVELHENEAKKEKYEVPVSPFYYISAIFLAASAGLVYSIIDNKFNVTRRLLSKFIGLKGKALKALITLVVCGVFSIIAEAVVARILKGGFEIYRFIFILAAALLLALALLCRKTVAEKPENFLVGVILVLGIAFSVIRPFGHTSWDFDSHYIWSLCSSYSGTVYVTEADRTCMNADIDSYISQNADENQTKINAINESFGVLSSIEQGFPRITHLPFGIFMALARFFGASFYQMLAFGRIGNVIFYAALCYFAVRKLKSGKILLSVIALMPTVLFEAASFTYDVWIIGLVFLGMAYFISESEEKDKDISLKDTIIMCSALALACLPKAVYALLLFIPFFMRKNNFSNMKRYYLICSLSLLLVIAFFAVKSLLAVSGEGDIRGGAVNPAEQVSYVLGDPMNYAKILFNFLKDYLAPERAYGYTVNFAYANIGKGSVMFLIFTVIAAFTDRPDSGIRRFGFALKGSVALIFAVTAVLIATAMYVSFTPVASQVINGCQPRYIIPLIYPLLSVVGFEGIKNNCNRILYNYSLTVPCILINLYNLAIIFLPRVI